MTRESRLLITLYVLFAAWMFSAGASVQGLVKNHWYAKNWEPKHPTIIYKTPYSGPGWTMINIDIDGRTGIIKPIAGYCEGKNHER